MIKILSKQMSKIIEYLKVIGNSNQQKGYTIKILLFIFIYSMIYRITFAFCMQATVSVVIPMYFSSNKKYIIRRIEFLDFTISDFCQNFN